VSTYPHRLFNNIIIPGVLDVPLKFTQHIQTSYLHTSELPMKILFPYILMAIETMQENSPFLITTDTRSTVFYNNSQISYQKLFLLPKPDQHLLFHNYYSLQRTFLMAISLLLPN
jgi:hypothetical protein